MDSQEQLEQEIECFEVFVKLDQKDLASEKNSTINKDEYGKKNEKQILNKNSLTL